MGIPPFRYESFSFRRETAAFTRVFHIFWQRKQLLPAPPDRSIGIWRARPAASALRTLGTRYSCRWAPRPVDSAENWDLAGRSPLLGEGGSRSETGVGRYNLPGSVPHPPQCAHWGTFPQGKASPRQIRICPTGFWVGARNAGVHNALEPQKHPLPDLGGDGGFRNSELRTVPSSSCRRRCPCPRQPEPSRWRRCRSWRYHRSWGWRCRRWSRK